MDLKRQNADIYGLVTQLVQHTLQKIRHENGDSYTSRNDAKVIKNLRSKAYEILLNKNCKRFHRENAANDPFLEILKHAFVLKLSLQRVSEAQDLEILTNGLISQENRENTIYSILQLLVELKNLQSDTRPILDIFHYGKANPLLPQDISITNNVSTFQTYPMESFILPEKFETMLGINKTYVRQDKSVNFINRVCFDDQYVSKAVLGIETIRYNNVARTFPCLSNYTDSTTKSYSMVATFLTPIMIDIEKTNRLCLSTQSFISNMILPWEWMESVKNEMEDENELMWKLDVNTNDSITNDLGYTRDNVDLIWNEIDLSNSYVSKLRTWESFGAPQSLKQTLFVTDLPETTLHLARIRQTSILSMLPKKTMNFIPLIQEVLPEQFLSDVKLLLFAIDSDSFKHNVTGGFQLEGNITVHGISSESLRISCREAICWGNSFKSLSRLVTPDSQTGKLQQDGLIFKAMCTNIKELLLYYRAALQRIFSRYKFYGLLNLLEKIRPLAHLIVEVAKLCECNKENECTLGKGSGILTHIYKEVTNVTNPKIALIFYSILKSCCEVYFQLLQSWLFEGTCEDIYGEFMIQVRSHYLRKRGRKFWTESFAIDTESVPGFLSDVAESILQCGKAVRLLKICSPKNPVCNISITAQPEVKVCLSVSMLREQLQRCREYESKGEVALGPIVSLLSAIQDQKKTERVTTDLVIRAQQDTLSRINRKREELLTKTAQSKRELLQALKAQAEQSALFKEKEKESEMLADKLLLEKMNREQQEIQKQQQAERQYLISYYDKLATDIENNRMRSNWRKARMNNFERRAEFLESVKKLDAAMLQSNVSTNLEENVVDIDERNKNVPVSFSASVSISKEETVPRQDENSNFTINEILNTTTNVPKHINSVENLLPSKISCIDSEMPSTEDCNSNKDVVLDEEVKNSLTTRCTQNVQLPDQTLPLNYIYRKNNERSNLQDFLRAEAIKNIHTVMNISSKQTLDSNVVDTHLHNILETADVTENLIGGINRPKSLAIARVDNITGAQANKLKVLLEEYGMTPNNNEFNAVFADNAQQIIDCTNVHNDGQVPLSTVDEQSLKNIKENEGDNASLIKLPEEMIIGPTNNERYLDNKIGTNDVQEILPNNVQQQNSVDTPMSCTTDNFTTLSTHSPLSQMQNSDDVFTLNAGKEISISDTVKSITEETYFESPMNNFKLPNVFGVSPDSKLTKYSSLTIADVEMIDHTSLQVYLEKSVIIPLQIQSQLINNAIIKYLLNEHNMLLHLHSLRSYFFLLNGEFAKSLTDSLYSRLYTISAPIELFNSAILTNLLEKALMNSCSNNYVNSELLSLSAVDKPCKLYISDPNVLECLCLNYKISWPLNIILDDTMMLQYSKVFKFLIMTGRMSWVLQEDFNIMKMGRNAIISEQYHKLQLYRHSMTQFMNALHNYLTCSVLHASWSEFEKDLQNSRTIDQIYLSHINYIKRILSRCMLNTRGENMRVCLINIFKIILKFHNRISSQAWAVGKTNRHKHPNFKSLEQMYQSFCEWRTYMAHVAHKLATSGYQPHLTHFLNALNINPMYDLTTKEN